MRGLNNFISEIRECNHQFLIKGRVRELEQARVNKELANIRGKFNDGKLDGYQRRKYVAKLVYIHILGYDVDFGFSEVINLIHSNKFNHKQMVLLIMLMKGYLAVALLLNDANKEYVDAVVYAIKSDLEDLNEVNNCLALQCIATVGNPKMAGALVDDIHKIAITSSSSPFVKKKALSALLRIYRRFPDLIPVENWYGKILELLDQYDLGVSHAAVSFLLAVAQVKPAAIYECVPKAIQRIHKIVCQREFSKDHVFYGVPSPWIQIKLLKLLQNYQNHADPELRNKLNDVLKTIISDKNVVSNDTNSVTPQTSNATRAIFFEAVNLVIQIAPNTGLSSQAIQTLTSFLTFKDVNIRYLALDALINVAKSGADKEPIYASQEIISQSLTDRDASVSRRALDLLFTMTSQSNYEWTVNELLKALELSDFSQREEIALKVAILAERFATDFKWYVDVSLKLISLAGEAISDEIWFRAIQIIVGNPSYWKYSATLAMQYSSDPYCLDEMIRVCGYLLGEYGHLIANDPGCAPIEQFKALHSKFGTCKPQTKVLLLTTYLKFCGHFPEMKSYIQAILDQLTTSLSTDIQQRAMEYKTLITNPEFEHLLKVCVQEMPPYAEKESILLTRLRKKAMSGEIGDKSAGEVKPPTLTRKNTKGLRSSPTKEKVAATVRQDSGDLIQVDEVVKRNGTITPRTASPRLPEAESGDEEKLRFCMLNNSGVLHEDHEIQIGVKAEYKDKSGRLAVYFGNKTMFTLASFTVTTSSMTGCVLDVIQPMASSLAPGSQLYQLYSVECVEPQMTFASMYISYEKPDGKKSILSLKLPIMMTKFISPVQMDASQFFSRWKQIGGPPREVRAEFPARLVDSHESMKALLNGLNLAILSDVDPSPQNFVASAIFTCISIGKTGCLVRIEALDMVI